MDIDPKNMNIVLGRTKTGGVYVKSTQRAVPESEDPLAQLSTESDSSKSVERGAGVRRDMARPLGWTQALARAQATATGSAASDRSLGSIELCNTVEEYARAVDLAIGKERLSKVPVLVSRYPLDAVAGVEGADDLKYSAPHPGKLCLALEDPVCLAGSRLLAGFTGRELHAVGREDWEKRLASVFVEEGWSSITVLLPYWTPDGQLDTTWLSATTRLLSDSVSTAHCAKVGIITGPTPGVFTCNIVKALLARQLATRNRAKPALVVAPKHEAATVLDSWHGGATGGLLRFDPEHVDQGTLLDEKFSAMIFRGHGRSYCGCEGYLCSARPPELSAESQVDSCLFGLDCLKSHYRRIDVRSYDALLMVLASCGAGNPDSGLDEAGVPPLAMLAASARPLAVIASRHHVRNELRAEEAQVVGAFAGSLSAGEGLSRLNRMRRQAGLTGDFYLLGDPELDSDVWCGNEWYDTTSVTRVTEGEGEWHAYIEHSDVPYTCITIKQPPQGTWYVWQAGAGEQLGPAAVLSSDDAAQLWFNCPKSRSNIDLWLSCRPRYELPPGLAQHAETIEADGEWWLDPIREELPRLINAGKEVQRCAKRLNEAGAIVRSSPVRDGELIKAAIREWLTAQHNCLEAVVGQRAEQILPWNLTGVHKTHAVTVEDECLCCGLSPTLLHRYMVTNALARELVECGHCEAVLDRPRPDALEIEIDAPKGMCFPESANVELAVTNTSAEQAAIGSVAVFVDSGAPVTGHPTILSFKLEPGESRIQLFSLEFDEEPSAAKRYGLRVIMLVNNELYWCGHKLIAADESRWAAIGWP
jgi:hypothetical protein